MIAIADHNTVDGALEAAAIAPGFGIEVVVGQASRTLFRGSTSADLGTAIENRTTHAWGPALSLTRTVRYARKIPEIKMRDRAARTRMSTEETG